MDVEGKLGERLPPVAGDNPCGTDLEATDDPDFLDYMAKWSTVVPERSYFHFDRNKENTPLVLFDPGPIDLVEARKVGLRLLERSHDLRLLVLLAKLEILHRHFDGFARWIGVIAQLLSDRWEELHPQGVAGDYSLRTAQLLALDDGPSVIMPLQYAPLAQTRREGVLTFRAKVFALQEANPIETEQALDEATIEKILSEADLAGLRQTLDTLNRIRSAVARIEAITQEKAGAKQAVTFDTLRPLIERMAVFVQSAVARRDPTVPSPEAPAADSADQGSIEPLATGYSSLADADAALASALAYFVKAEPSSAAVLLIGQARQLLGKNLYEVMKILAPNHADLARISVGAEPAFAIPISGIPPSEDGAGSGPSPPGEMPPSRAVALSLIASVGTYLRKVEPSSPVPFLLDRASSLATRDFLGLLKELLSEDTLAQMRQ